MTNKAPQRYVALLRGINVGGNRRVPMAELKGALAEGGFSNVVTYLQSGNVVFTAPAGETQLSLEAALEGLIDRHFAMPISVLVRSGSRVAALVNDNPFPSATDQPSRLFVTFLRAKPAKDLEKSIIATDFAPDQVHFAGSELYFFCPNGLSQSPMMKVSWDKRLAMATTTRNWNTVTKLAALAADV